MDIKINIPKNPNIAIKMLSTAGFEAGIVGGCIRDALIGSSPYDWDICTSATPNEIKDVFKGFKHLDIGLKHGTIVIIINGEQIEITTYRIDGIYSDGRRPDEVCFTRTLIEDLSRRDFCINAIFYNNEQGIIDPFNGLSDIKNKIVRCVGNPDKRLKEDALRILRGIRFASKLDFNIAESTKQAMFANKNLLKNVSKERIAIEFTKILCGKNAINIIDEFKEIIVSIIPETKAMMGFKQNNSYDTYDVWKHSLYAVNNVHSLLLKLTMFFHDIGKPNCYTCDANEIKHFFNHSEISAKITSEILKKMKLTNSENINKNDINDILELIKLHNYTINPNKKSVKKLLSKMDGNTIQFERLLLVKKADILAQSPINQKERLNEIDIINDILNEIIKENCCLTLKDLAITGQDLIAIGIPRGIIIGEILNTLLQNVIDETLPNEKDALLKEAKKIKTHFK